MPRSIVDKQIGKAGEEIRILREGRTYRERHFIKLNRQVSKEDHLFNSVKCLFQSRTKAIPGDILYLTKREPIERYYWVESKKELVAQNRLIFFQLTLKRINATMKIVESIARPASDPTQLDSYTYQPEITLSDEDRFIYVRNPNAFDEQGRNINLNTDETYLFMPYYYPVKSNDIIRVTPISDLTPPVHLSQYYQLRHFNTVDFPNTIFIRAKNLSLKEVIDGAKV